MQRSSEATVLATREESSFSLKKSPLEVFSRDLLTGITHQEERVASVRMLIRTESKSGQ